MPVELRKRPAPKEPATAAPPTKRGSGAGSTAKKLAEKAKAAVTSKATKDDSVQTAAEAPTTTAAEPKTNGTVGTGGKIGVGEKITLDGFGGTLQTNDGQDVTLKELLEKSLAGIVIFTYPRASTPGCTTQACLFRDNYAPITGASLSIYGLSTDSPKANSTFATKQKLQYALLVSQIQLVVQAKPRLENRATDEWIPRSAIQMQH